MTRRSRTRNKQPMIDSVCNEIRVHGTLTQVIQKFRQLADEAEDKVTAELYRQQVEHFTREQNRLRDEDARR